MGAIQTNALIISLAVLNVLDAILTAIGLHIGYAWELNPIMRWVWSNSPFWFIGIKVIFSVMLIVFCYNLHSKLFNRLLWFAFIVYCLIITQHIIVTSYAILYF
ncbi:DUF5658 family protein [Alkalibacillus sp. S2W]|uniref:DUF5658 family protein n=1 Tax=Alkalibacillus sp. S2W TaxID=3386553 RepID=UPI00398CF774